MIGTGTSRALLAAVGCLLLASCGAAKTSTAPPGAIPAATSSAATPAAASAAASSAATPATTAAAVSAGGSGLTACELITEQDASTAIGKAVGRGTPGGSAALSECIYDDGGLIVGMKENSKTFYANSLAGARAKGLPEVHGIGDNAFQCSTDTTFSAVQFLKGTTLLTVLVRRQAGARDAALAVAKIAASKL